MIADPHKLGNPDAFDDLADLFLGQMGTVHAHDAAVGAVPMARGVECVGASPQASARGPITTAERSPPAPRLTLVSDGEATRVEPASRAVGGEPPCVEALVLGHLPVMSAAWATQYVRHVADRVQGPVAMVRLGSAGAATVRIELHAPAGCRPEVRVGTGFESALGTIHAGARRIVIAGPASSEMEVVGTAGVGRVTLLTSGDEAGIVAAYGLVKSIAGRLREGRGIDPSGVLRVAVMGSPPSRADFVIGRLRDAARAFLGLELPSDTCIARIGSTPGHAGIVLYEGALGATIEDLVAMVGLGSVGVVEPRLALRGDDDRADEIDDTGATGTDERAPEDVMVVAADEEMDSDGRPAATGDEAESMEPDSSEVVLSGFVAGVTALEARCPFAEEVEIGIESPEEGAGASAVHVAVRAERYAERGRALERLAIAAEWARAHRRVLELTLKSGGAGGAAVRLSEAEPKRHVFTDQPAQWRRLLDAGVRVHALVPKDSDGEDDGEAVAVGRSRRRAAARRGGVGGWVSVSIN